MRRFEYYVPGTLQEAVALLAEHRDAALLAGGTDLLLQMKGGKKEPEVLVDLKRISGFGDLDFSVRTGLEIGPAVTLAQIERSGVVWQRFQAVAQGASLVGSVQIRNRATLVGNICNAAPSADTAPGLLVLDARVRVIGPEGRRTIRLEKFFAGPGRTALAPGEFVVGVRLPTPGARSGSAYARHTTRAAMDIAVVGVGVSVSLVPRREVCREVRIGLGAVAPTPMRARRAEKILRGREITPDLVSEAAECAASEASPISDVRASADYRRELVEVLTRRMIFAAVENARQKLASRRRAA